MQQPISFPKLAGAVLLLATGSATAENLNSIYSLAEQNDPQFRAARAQYMADSEAPYQAWGAVLPQISGSMYRSKITGDLTSTSSTPPVTSYDYYSNGYSLKLTQTIYDHAKFAQISQANAVSAEALANFHNAEQQLILSAAERYFNVLAAQDNLAFTRAEKKSIARQLQQTQQRFNVGLTAITDVHEAQARYDQSVAQDIAAKNKLAISREELREMTGKDHPKLDSLLNTTPLLEPNPTDINQWVKTALTSNFSLLAAREAVKAASAGISKARAGHYPNLNVVASKSYDDVGGGMFGAREQDDTTLMLQLNMSLFNGGAVMSQSREAVYRQQQSKEILEQTRRATERQARSAYLSVLANISQVKALKQALASSQIALKATTAGFKVGTRTTVDVLNSQRDLFRAKLNYALARYEYIMETLRLKQAAGTLSKQDLLAINKWLESA